MKKNINIEKKIYFSSMIGEVCAISLEHDLHFVDSNDIEGNLVISGRYRATVASQIEQDFEEKVPVEITVTDKLDIDTCKIDIIDFTYSIIDSSNLNCNIVLSIEGEKIEDRECDGDPASSKELEIPKLEDVPKKIDSIKEEKVEVLDEKKDIELEDARDDGDVVDIAKEKEEVFQEKINDKTKDVVEDNAEVEEKEIVDDEDMIADSEEKEEDIIDEDNMINDADNLLFNIDTTNETYGTFIVYMVRQNETINTILEKYSTTLEEVEKYNDIKDLSIGTKLIIPIINEKDK